MNSFALRTSILGLSLLLAAVPAMAKDKAEKSDDAAVASVNGKKILKSSVDAIVKLQTAQGRPDSEELRKQIRENLIQGEILAQEAAKKGIDKKPEVKVQVDLQARSALINAYLNDYAASHPISDEALKKEYETVHTQAGDKEYKVRHILVDKEDEAKAIIEKLKKGAKFEELAKDSKDPGSKDNGGDLSWSAPASFVKPFADALTKLEKGKYTETPVKTDFGYHVILLEDTRELKFPSFEELKPRLMQGMQNQLIEKHFAELKSKAKVE